MTRLESNGPDRRSTPLPPSTSLPPLGEHVVVHCPGFSCLGYLDRDGTWKNAFTLETLPEVIGFSLLT